MPAKRLAAPPDRSPAPRRRKGASRIADIPPETLSALNAGTEPTRSLVEWLAVDQRALSAAVAAAVGMSKVDAAHLTRAAEAVAELGVTRRQRGIGAALGELVGSDARYVERLLAQPSDIARGWLAYAIAADGRASWATLLGRMAPLADDDSPNTRECAWDAWRPRLIGDLSGGLAALRAWGQDDRANLRRCAVEGSRPRGVWTVHIQALRDAPSLGECLLEPLRADPSRTVQNAVANWINDASKDQPGWAEALCARWRAESPSAVTAYIVKRGMRSLAKRASSAR